MIFSVLGSGSGGNSVYIQSGKTGLLIDAGFSGKQIDRRLGEIGKKAEDIKAICLTHEHRDHVIGVGVLARRFKLPVWANSGTFEGGQAIIKTLPAAREFETGDILQIHDLEVRSFRIHHDTPDPVGYTISDGTRKIGYCTDTGHASHLMVERLKGCDVIIIEFNHDPDLLRFGPYPLQLQQRVRSRQGHLANEEAASFLGKICHDKLQCAVLAHLSETNNTPQHALRATQPISHLWPHLQIAVADQHSPLPLFTVI